MEPLLFKDSFKLPEKPVASLSVYNTGRQRCQAGYAWGPGVRDHYLVHCITAGHGTYTVHGQAHALRAGDMFLARPGETIHYAADARDPWTYCWVGFNGIDAAAFFSGTDFSGEKPVLHFDDDTPQRLLLDIFSAHGGQPFHALRLTGRLCLFLSWLQENAAHPGRQRVSPDEMYAKGACAYIENNYANPITVEDIARHVGVCRSRLYRAFQQQLRVSPQQHLTRLRMRHACALLEKKELSVKEIAFSVGFADPLYFSRRFREIVGCAPTEYGVNQTR